MANYNVAYTMVSNIHDDVGIDSKRHAIKIAQMDLKVGDVFDVYKECGIKHRRNPGQTLRTRYIKILVRKVCSGCLAILNSQTRVVIFTKQLLNDPIVEKFVDRTDSCPNPYCNLYYKECDNGIDGDDWTAEDWRNKNQCMYAKWLHNYNKILFRSSDHAILKNLKFSENGCENCVPYFIHDHLTFEEYMTLWRDDYITDDIIADPFEVYYWSRHPAPMTQQEKAEYEWWQKNVCDMARSQQ